LGAIPHSDLPQENISRTEAEGLPITPAAFSRRESEEDRPKAPLKDINLPPLQRQVDTSPTTFRAFRKIVMRSEKRKAR
jgi:hypothetical protein